MKPDEVPESWHLAFALDRVAREAGWTPVGRMTSVDEVTVTYRRDPIVALIDALPGGQDE